MAFRRMTIRVATGVRSAFAERQITQAPASPMPAKHNLTMMTRLLIGALCLALLWTSCGGGEAGCLDVNATNFDVAADAACSNCCEYPTLSLRFNHRVQDSLDFQLNAPYLDARGVAFEVSRLRFYVSGVALVLDSGDTVRVRESLALPLLDGSEALITDDVSLVEKRIGTYSTVEVGTVIGSGTATQLLLYLGLRAPATVADVAAMAAGHPLGAQTPSLHDGTTYVQQEWVVQPDTSDASSLRELRYTDAAIPLQWPIAVTLRRGYDTQLTLQVDYAVWWQGVDFTASEATIWQQLSANLPSAITVVP